MKKLLIGIMFAVAAVATLHCEAAVAAFLARKIPFLKIGELVTAALDTLPVSPLTCYEDVVRADRAAREFVAGQIAGEPVKA